MYYLYNEENIYCGISDIPLEHSTEKPVKLLQDGEQAEWNGREWVYKYIVHEKLFHNLYSITDFGSLPVFQLNGIMHGLMRYTGGKIDIPYDGKVSVIIPCYGKAKYIERTVQSCVNQTVKPEGIYILIMDEESAALMDRLESYPGVHCIEHERLNASEARMYLAELCPDDWIIVLDADDKLAPDYIEVMSKQKGVVRWCNAAVINEGDDENLIINHIKSNPGIKPLTEILKDNNTCFINRKVFLEYGLKSEFCSGGEDTDFQYRVLGDGKYLVSYTEDTHFVYYSDTENSLTEKFKDFYESFLRVLESNSGNILKGLERSTYESRTTAALRWLMTDFSETKMYACLDYCNGLSNLYDYRFSHFMTDLYHEYLDRSRRKEPAGMILDGSVLNTDVILPYKNIRSFHEVQKQADECIISDKVRSEIENIGFHSTLSRLFYLLSNYHCTESGGIIHEPYVIPADLEIAETFESLDLPELKNYREIWTVGQNLHDYIRNSKNEKLQKVTFTFSKKCNERCPYCVQAVHTDTLTEDEMFANFCVAMDKCEKLTDKKMIPQIMGGEPTLFSEKLTRKILNRLHDYKIITLLTNGANPDSLFFKDWRCDILQHVIYWQDKTPGYFAKKDNLHYLIIITAGDEAAFKEFVSKSGIEYRDVVVDFCRSDKPEYNVTPELKKRLYEIGKGKVKFSNSGNFDCDIFTGDFEGIRAECRKAQKIWSFDCGTGKCSPCCILPEYMDIEDFKGDNLIPCKDCSAFMFI